MNNQNAVLVRYFSKTKKCMDPKHVTVFAQSIDLSETEDFDKLLEMILI